RFPRVQVMVPFFVFGFDVERLQLPLVDETESKWTLAGKGSVTVTPVASSGPPFATVSAYVSRFPLVTGFGLPEFVIERSAPPTGVVLSATEMVPVPVRLSKSSFAPTMSGRPSPLKSPVASELGLLH